MTKRQRVVLFFICASLFLLSAIIIVFYSQGFRFDFEKKKITQTGAFYFKVLPKSTQVYLDDQSKKKAAFFFGSIFIDNLLPKKYNIKIKKEGHFTWEKNLEIKEKEVTEAKNIILIKKSPNFFPLIKGVEKFFFSPDEKKIILLETKETGWEIKLYDLKNNIKSHLIKSIDIGKKGVDFLDLNFSSDSKKLLLKVVLKENLKYYLIDLDKTPVVLTPLDFLAEDLEGISFNPKDSQKLFFLQKGKLKEADLIRKEFSPTPLENVLTWTILNGNIYYLEKSGYLFKTDSFFGGRERINEIVFPLKDETKYEISVFPEFFFLKENEALYFLNPETKAFEKFFEGVKKLKISPDFEKLVYFTDSEIWVLFLKEQYGQPPKKTGEKLFLTRFSDKIEELFWFSSHYLVFNSGNKIKIAEVDERDRINIFDLTEFSSVAKSYGGSSEAFGEGGKNPKIYFNQTDKKLYLLSEGNLFSSEKLLP